MIKLGRVDLDLCWAIILDMDGTLYENSAYLEDGARNEILCVAKEFGWTTPEAEQRIRDRRVQLTQKNGVKATMSQTVLSFGLGLDWWNSVRAEICYHPEKFLYPDKEVKELLAFLKIQGRHLCVGTNSPHAVARRVLRRLELDRVLNSDQVFAPDQIGCTKPDPRFYSDIAALIGAPARCCLSIGDREDADGKPARRAGMAAIIVQPPNGLKKVLAQLAR